MDTLSLWATCIVPGCRQPVADELDVCGTCRTVFGDYLRETDRPRSYTIADIEARDAGVRAAYLAQFALRSVPAEIDTASAEYRRAVVEARTVAQAAGEAEEPGQTCWMCEQRRSCIRRERGWECRECRQIR